MTTLQGEAEHQAAQKTLEFMRAEAAKLEEHYATLRWWVWKRNRYRFTAKAEKLGGDSMRSEASQPLSLTSVFSISIAGKGLERFAPSPTNWIEKMFVEEMKAGKPAPFLSGMFWRADWDEDPHMRGAVCTLHFAQLTPPFIYEDLYAFVEQTFGCRKIQFFGVDEVKTSIDRINRSVSTEL